RHRGARDGAGGALGNLPRGSLVGDDARNGKTGRAAQYRRAAPARVLGAVGPADARWRSMKRDAALALEDVTRAQVEDFLYREAELLDEWRLDEWLGLLTDDAHYFVPSNDRPEADPANSLFTIADDIQRIRGRVTRLK